MSYDFEIADTYINYTWNCGDMFREALQVNDIYDDLSGKTGKKMQPILKKGIEEMQKKPTKYKKMNPKNGWGNYDGALQVLKELYQACLKNPRYKFKIF